MERSEYQQSLIDAFEGMSQPVQDRWITVEMTEDDRREWEKLHAYMLSGDFTSVEELVREFYRLKEENTRLQFDLDCASDVAKSAILNAEKLKREREYLCGDLYDLVCQDSQPPESIEAQTPTEAQTPKDSSIRLTTEQRDGLADLALFLNSSELLYRIIGYAGTGKSFLICEFIKWLNYNKISYMAACPTNKAAKNLRNIAAESGLELEVKTVAQLLGQQPELNEETGKEEFISQGNDIFGQYRVIIIDEFSMVNRENFGEIIDESHKHGNKVIFVGDAAQLPPVKEQEPMAATYPMRDTTLSKVIRYDGDLARIAEAIRSNPIVPTFSSTADKTLVCLPQEEWLRRAFELFDSEEFGENSDYVRILAWRNKTVNALNDAVRLHLWGESANPYVPGDRLIALNPLFRPKPGAKGKNKWGIFINNSEEAIVTKEGKLSEMKINKDIYRFWDVTVRSDMGGKEAKLLILHEDSKKLHQEKIKEYVAKKQWNQYFDLSRMFDNVGYAYALTVHKAQGSTIHNVFLDADDMMRSSDRQKLLYTALTRTKNQAFVCQ